MHPSTETTEYSGTFKNKKNCSLKYIKLSKLQKHQKHCLSTVGNMAIYLRSSNISLRCSIIVSIDIFPQVPLSWMPSHNVQIPAFTFHRFAYRDLTCLAPKCCCIFYFSRLFITVLTIVTLLRKSNFF